VPKNSLKLQFMLDHYENIILLETCLKEVLSLDSLKSDPFLACKLLDNDFLPFKSAHLLQKVFKEEKSFFLALSFIKRVEVCRSVNQKSRD
jgi:hypothetical protein